MATDVLEYNDIYLLVRGALNDGRLKLHAGGVIFRANKTGKVDQATVADIESTQWMRVARGFELKVSLTNGLQFKFEGFKESDFDQLSAFVKKHFSMDLEEVELSVKGWNWGVAKFKGSSLSFEVDEKPAFVVPLKDVSQATTGKNEVTLEFHQHDDAQICLMEMRFYIPATTATDGSTVDPVKHFHEQVLQKADIIQATGDAIVTLPDVACLTPRGRYSMKVFPSFLQLHGKTYDYKIPYTSVLRLFLLPHKDQRFMFFVVSMDPPIKQGQTRYPFLIIQFEKDEEFDVKLNLTEEELLEKYEGKITQEMSGPIYEIVSRLMKAVIGRRITVPGTFKSHAGISCITCSYKAGSGMLYPLERGFIFVHKPPVHVRFDEISSVNFARVQGGGGSSRSFDFEVETKSGTTYVFSSIEKEEYIKLYDFVSGKNLRIKNTGKNKGSSAKYEDELMPGSDEDTHDAYLAQVKAEGAEKDDDDSESSEGDSDDSFAPESGAEDQDVREEFESNPSSSESESGSDEEGKSKQKEKEKKTKAPEKKRKSSEPSASKPPKKKAKVAADKPEGNRKKKAKKDKDAPKRPMTAYMLWMNEIRAQIKEENPGISVTELSKKAGEMWKNVQDKSKWQEKSQEAKKKYEEDMKAYKAKKANEPDDESPEESKPKKKGLVKESSDKRKDSEKKKTSSPRKSGDSQKFKSAEFVDTDDSSSEDEGGKAKGKSKPKPKAKAEKAKSKIKKEPEVESEDDVEESEEEEEEMSEGSDSD